LGKKWFIKMLIDFKYLCDKYNFIPKGIIHIGAHMVEERSKYLSCGVNNIIWIEANPDLYNKISIFKSSNEMVLNYVVSSDDDIEYDFMITNNGESSSILELDKHKIHHPHIHVVDNIKLKSKKMDTIVYENNIDVSKYNFMNIDIQGAELLALNGSIDLLDNIDYIYTEVNSASLYKDCGLISEIDTFLSVFGFVRMETNMTEYEWGDAFYVKNKN